jgi:hypothetical protein
VPYHWQLGLLLYPSERMLDDWHIRQTVIIIVKSSVVDFFHDGEEAFLGEYGDKYQIDGP